MLVGVTNITPARAPAYAGCVVEIAILAQELIKRVPSHIDEEKVRDNIRSRTLAVRHGNAGRGSVLPRKVGQSGGLDACFDAVLRGELLDVEPE